MAARQWASNLAPQLVTVWGLVVMADAPGKLPRPLTAQLKLVGGVVPRTWVVPWVPEWRLAPPERATAPAVIKKLGTDLRSDAWVTR